MNLNIRTKYNNLIRLAYAQLQQIQGEILICDSNVTLTAIK